MPAKVADMRAHIERLVKESEIVVSECDRPTKAWGAYDIREICIPQIKSEISYCVALHEVGHIKGRFQNSRSLLIREQYAWVWAKSNAIIWTTLMERRRADSLAWYFKSIAEGILEPARNA